MNALLFWRSHVLPTMAFSTKQIYNYKPCCDNKSNTVGCLIFYLYIYMFDPTLPSYKFFPFLLFVYCFKLHIQRRTQTPMLEAGFEPAILWTKRVESGHASTPWATRTGYLTQGETESPVRAKHNIDQRHHLWKTVMMLEWIITSSPYFKIK